MKVMTAELGRAMMERKAEREAEERRQAKQQFEEDAAELRDQRPLTERWGVPEGAFAGEDEQRSLAFPVGKEAEPEGQEVGTIPGLETAKEIGDIAAQLVLAGTSSESSQFRVGADVYFGIQLLGDSRVAAEVVRLAGARLAALAPLVPEAYRVILTDDKPDNMAYRGAMARDLATRLGYTAPKEGGAPGFLGKRAALRAKRLEAEERVRISRQDIDI